MDPFSKPKFGIISGAGPMAGVVLLKRIIETFQKYEAWKDIHFPEIHSINFPFSEMLTSPFDTQKLHKELMNCIKDLQKRCDYFVIACQTLHLFLPKKPIPGLIHLFDLIKEVLPQKQMPLVVATRTTTNANLHGSLLGTPCDYFDPEKSQDTIDKVLRGIPVNLDWLIELSHTRPVILGCTEYSVALENIPDSLNIIDPLRLASQRVHDLYRDAEGNIKIAINA